MHQVFETRTSFEPMHNSKALKTVVKNGKTISYYVDKNFASYDTLDNIDDKKASKLLLSVLPRDSDDHLWLADQPAPI